MPLVTEPADRDATAALASFVVETGYDRLPRPVVEAAKVGILDGIGNVLAGSREPVARIVAGYVQAMGGAPECAVVGFGLRTNPPQAAFANGVFLHCLDFEVQGDPPAHGTSAILPPVLALAERHGLPGRAIVTAYVVGWDVQARLRSASPPRPPRRFHPPGVFGPLAAAAATASLLGLSREQVRTSLGIAASRTGGLLAHNGTMVKSTHPGNAGRLGLEATLLAQAGFTSHPAVLEAHEGYVETLFGDEFDWQQVTHDLGTRFHLVEPGINIKRYPAEIYLQWAIDAVLELRAQHDLRPEQVETLELEVPPLQATLARPRPAGGLDGKFSWQYCAAVALVEGQVGIDSFTDTTRFSPAVEEALAKIRVVANPDLPTDMQHLSITARARLRDGRAVQARCRAYRGSIGNPMSRDERLAKVSACASRVLAAPQIERVLALVEALEDLPDVRELMDLLGHAPAAVG